MQGAAERLKAVRARIGACERASGRAPGSVTLIAVSKTIAAEDIVSVLAAGQRAFGENRVQEAAGKWPVLRARFPDVTLHLIGPLQTNKVRDAVALFDVIQTLDRDRLADALAAEMTRSGRRPALFVQVNVGREPQKAGIAPEEAVAFVARCRDTYGLAITGLMGIPPVDADPAPHFAALAALARALALPHLSMGMSGDVDAAIKGGATHVRVGTAIFGARF